MTDMTVFDFDQSGVRTVLIDGEPWFVAADVLNALDYAETSNASRVMANVPAEWKGVNQIHTPGGVQNIATLSEQGLYFFLGRSDKPKALPLQKWVAGSVLPSIRKTGGYSANTGIASKKPSQSPSDAFKLVPLAVKAALALGLDKNAAAISANQAVTKITGTNVMQLLGHTHIEAEKQAILLTPTELGANYLGGISGRKVNMLLAEAGLQAKKGEHWVPLPAAEGLCRVLDTSKKRGDGAMIQQVKWLEGVVALLQKAEAA